MGSNSESRCLAAFGSPFCLRIKGISVNLPLDVFEGPESREVENVMLFCIVVVFGRSMAAHCLQWNGDEICFVQWLDFEVQGSFGGFVVLYGHKRPVAD